MTVTEQVIAYQVKQVSTQATLDLVALDLPETTFETEAIWFSPPDEHARRHRPDADSSSARSTPPSTR